MIGNFHYGTGRRKSAVARVFIKSGKGAIVVNGKPVDQFFARETGRMIVRQPLELTNNLEAFDIMVTVAGGGESGQSGGGAQNGQAVVDESGDGDSGGGSQAGGKGDTLADFGRQGFFGAGALFGLFDHVLHGGALEAIDGPASGVGLGQVAEQLVASEVQGGRVQLDFHSLDCSLVV